MNRKPLSATSTRRILAMAGASIVALSAGEAFAGDLRGAVIDANTGQRLVGASVRLTGSARTSVTDDGGVFNFQALPAGSYTVSVDYVGYRAASETVTVGEAGVTDIRIRIGGEAEVEGIVVTGTRAALVEALQVKRTASAIVDAVSADDVGKLPDNNIADALQRLPGLSVTIDQGEGRYVLVRGIDSNLVNVTVNGQVFPGPEGGARRVALDTFPADIVSRIEVVKAQTPDLDANAVGGTVNLVTASAFDTPDGFLRGSFRYGYNQLGETENYSANAGVARLFGADRQFGVVIGASFSQREFESDNYEASGFRAVNGQILPTTRVLRDYRIVRNRTGLVANFEWRPTDDIQLYLNNTYTRYSDDEQRDSSTIDYALGALSNQGPGTGNYSQGRGTVELRDRKVTQTLVNHSLGGIFTRGQATLDLNATFAQADEDTPKRVDWEFRSANGAFPNSFDATGLYLKINAPLLADASRYPFRRVRTRTDAVSEETQAFTGSLRWDFAERDGYLKAGLRHVIREKSWDRTNADFGAVTGGTFVLADVDRPGAYDHLGDNYSQGPVIERGQIMAYFEANRARFTVDAASTLANSLVTDFQAEEKVTAGYAMGQTDFAGVEITAGVRVEHTKAEYSSYDIQRRQGSIVGFPIRRGETDYTHVLPDILARYDVNDALVLRAAYTSTIGRPNYTDLVPRRDFDAAEVSPGVFQGAYSEGNPELKPYESQNLDASVEYYLRPAGILSLGLFHKKIDNPVFSRTINNVNVAFEGRQFGRLDVTRPENADEGKLTGLEINYQQQFDFLPDMARGFGLSVNATFVDSQTKVFGRTDELPFFRQSDRLANAAVFYERAGFEARLAVTHRSPYLEAVVSPGFDVYVDTRTQVDFKMSYAVEERFVITADLLNINNSPLRYYSGSDRYVQAEERYGPSASIGLNVAF